MSTVKITTTIDKPVLSRLDQMVKSKVFKNRSFAIQKSIEDELKLIEKQKFIEACKKLDYKEEQALADEKLEAEEWQTY